MDDCPIQALANRLHGAVDSSAASVEKRGEILKSQINFLMKLVPGKHCFVLVALSLTLAGSAAAQNLFVANSLDDDILEFNPDGTGGIYATGLNNPHGVAFNNAGVLFESDFGSGNIFEFNSAGSSPTTFASGLSSPDGMSFNQQGDLFVVNKGKGQVLEFTPSGTQSIFASGLTNPLRLAIDNSGDVFVGNGTGGDIFEYSPTGTRTTFASGLTDARGLAFNSAGNLFEADYESGNIYEFSPTGTKTLFASGLNYPFALAFDKAGNLFVSIGDSGTDGDSIIEYAVDGTQSILASGLTPLGLAFEPAPEPSVSALMALGGIAFLLLFRWRRAGRSRA